MSVLSTATRALLSAACGFTFMTAAGCGTDAKGVDDCRDIEEARCSADKNCGVIMNVTECQNYYRDQCLHGLPVNPPGSAAIKACVATIHAAGLCALEGMDTAPSDCSAGNPSQSMMTSAKTTCEIVSNPEKTQECAFLMPNMDAGTASAGSGGAVGSAGSGGATDAGGAGGASGQAGAADLN
jgi:hypothetical protein